MQNIFLDIADPEPIGASPVLAIVLVVLAVAVIAGVVCIVKKIKNSKKD